jgi:ATP-dependent helicase/nuclease subunit A
MTYAIPNIQKELDEISLRMALSDRLLMTSEADCPGYWILMTALSHRNSGWSIQIVRPAELSLASAGQVSTPLCQLPDEVTTRIKKTLNFRYAHKAATEVPSKQTATQIKGRIKDREAAENTAQPMENQRSWRKPKFVQPEQDHTYHGTAMHKVMQYISFADCTDIPSVEMEVERLVKIGLVTAEQAAVVNIRQIYDFFTTDIGKRLRCGKELLREFKFSVLADANSYCPDVFGEQILLQGVVDCALIEDDGIIIVDFKTDRVTSEDIQFAAQKYQAQLTAYARAMEAIYDLPVKSAQLYFFAIGEFVPVI